MTATRVYTQEEGDELRQAIIDIIGEVEHDDNGRWIAKTLGDGRAYLGKGLNSALDKALRLAIKQR